MTNKYVYLFNEGNTSVKNLLGGKGANLAEMTNIGIPVPFGFIVTTEVCNKYYEDGEKIKVIRDNARVKPFLVMYGYTNDATDLIGGNEKWLNKLSSSEEDSVMPWLDQIWTIKSGKTTKSIKPEKFFNIEEYWKGMVAIPYKKESASIVNSMVGQGPREVVTTIGDSQRNLAYSSNAPLNANVSASQLNK